MVIIDCLLERKAPFSPEAVTHEFSRVLDAYGITSVQGDRYAGEWPRDAWKKTGVAYELSLLNRSQLYVELLPKLSGGSIELLANDTLVKQLVALERKTGRGADIIDHPPGGHDDLANVVAGVSNMVISKTRHRAKVSCGTAGGTVDTNYGDGRGFVPGFTPSMNANGKPKTWQSAA